MQTNESNTFTEREDTRIYKGSYGWAGKTRVKANGRNWVISTSKYNAGIVSSAQAVQDEGGGSYSFAMIGGDEGDRFNLVVSDRGAKATEKAVTEQHYKALAIFHEKMENMPEEEKKVYEIKVGQVIFTEHHGRVRDRVVCEVIREGKYRTVLLDGSGFEHDDHVKDIEKKFGIGAYYVKGEMMTEDEVSNLVILAKENEAKRNEEARIEREAREAKRLADLEAGAKIVTHIPVWAKALICGFHEVNESDPQSDYHGSSTDKTIYLAFSRHHRDLFDEMRRAADRSPDTAHLGTGKGYFNVREMREDNFMGLVEGTVYTREEAEALKAELEAKNDPRKYEIEEREIEHREKYSMGAGYYLAHHRHSGWHVKKSHTTIDDSNRDKVLEKLQIAAANGCYFIGDEDAQGGEDEGRPVSMAGVTISRNHEKNGIEIKFDKRPDEATITLVKGLGFRWSKFQKLWYARFSESLYKRVQESIFGVSPDVEKYQDGAGAMVQANEEAYFENFQVEDGSMGRG